MVVVVVVVVDVVDVDVVVGAAGDVVGDGVGGPLVEAVVDDCRKSPEASLADSSIGSTDRSAAIVVVHAVSVTVPISAAHVA